MRKYIIKDIPPSNNKYMGRTAKGFNFTYQDEKRKWEWLVKGAVGRSRPKQPIKKAVVTLTYYFGTKHRRDPDNYSGKFILDGLVKAKVLEDDSFANIKLVLVGDYDKNNPRTEIKVEGVQCC